jgi:amino acid efflux transporter
MPEDDEGKRTSGLKRDVALRHAIAMYLSSIIGPGVLVIPGLAAVIAGPASLFVWLVLSLASYPLAFTFASLATRSPLSGGIYSFTKEGLGQMYANAVGWLFAFGYIVGTPAATLIAGYYVAYTFSMNKALVFIVAAAMVLASLGINYRGVLFSGRIQLVVTALMVGLLVSAVILSIPYVRLDNFGGTSVGIGPLGVAAALIVWSYFGYENVPNVAEEFKDPKRDFQRSVVLSVIISGALYMLVSFSVIGTGVYTSGGSDAPFASLMSLLLGRYGEVATMVIALIIIFGTVNAYTTGISRVIYAAARDGGFPLSMSRINHRTGVPVTAIIAITVGSVVSMLVFYSFDVNLQTILLASNGIVLTIYVFGAAASIRLLKVSGVTRLFPWFSLALPLMLLPFVGYILGVVLLVVAASFAYSILKGRRTNSGNS